MTDQRRSKLRSEERNHNREPLYGYNNVLICTQIYQRSTEPYITYQAN